MHLSTTKNMESRKRVLRYLAGTKDLRLTYHITDYANLNLQAFTDADWSNNKKYRKNSISWNTKKQNCLSMSTAEAEIVATATLFLNLRSLI